MRSSLLTTVFLGCLLILATGCIGTKEEPAPGPAVDGIAEAELVKNNNQFAFDLYAKIRGEPGNLFVSPASISTALAMTYAGARGTTAEQMAKTLHFPADEKKLHPTLAGLNKKIQAGQGKGYEIQMANALWVQQGFGLQPAFLDTMKSHYGAGVREVDYIGGTDAACKSINGWVEQQTKERIKGLLQPSDLDKLTRLVLTNAIYFKGSWGARFPKTGTRDRPFYRKNGDFVTFPMMAQCAPFPYWESDTLQVAEFPYVGKQLSMSIFLPRSAEGLPAFEKTVTPEKIAEWSSKLSEQKINVYLPRFKVTQRLDLKESLRDMGMPLAFDSDKADFTGMTGTDPQKKLHISKVIHEAFVEINEEGTEAAGSTAVVGTAKSVKGPVEPEPPTFEANRPFLFVIRDNRSGSILFIGRLSDPTK
jgi:serpin B